MGEKARPDTLSVNVTKLNEAAKQYGNTAQNGDVYITLTSWRNDEKNDWGKDISIQVKDKDNPSLKFFVGNGWRGDTPWDGASGGAAKPPMEDLPPQQARDYKSRTSISQDEDPFI
jgi:hypothetical protein